MCNALLPGFLHEPQEFRLERVNELWQQGVIYLKRTLDALLLCKCAISQVALEVGPTDGRYVAQFVEKGSIVVAPWPKNPSGSACARTFAGRAAGHTRMAMVRSAAA